jgi:hypothetical protein
MPTFIPGILLNEMFYREAVAPILASAFPGLRYSAALIGYGSDVLGFDSERSTDHEWGPRLTVFLTEADHGALASSISETLSVKLPAEFRGYSTNFSEPDENRVRVLETAGAGRVRHHVYFQTWAQFTRQYLGIEPHQELTSIDWLLMYQNALLEVTGGAVYHDGLGELIRVRERLAWYPHEVWLYMLASQWIRLAQEEPFASRCGEGGDEIGSRLIAARLVRDVMRLCFLMERRYAPYSKWLGAAFSRLKCAAELGPILRDALAGDSWQAREQHLCAAYQAAARMHNDMGIFKALDVSTMSFHNRPYRVLGAGRFAKAVSDEIRDDQLRQIYEKAGPIGSIDQYADSTNLLMRPDLRTRLRVLYEAAT